MNLTQLTKTTTRAKKRLGQGHGSGRVKTSGRGTKGQKARGKIPFTRYSGGSLAFVKSLPFLRGKDRNNPFFATPVLVNVGQLNTLPKDTVVDMESLAKHGMVKLTEAKQYGVKILGDGDLSVALTVKLPVSGGAKTKIEKAGGTVQ